jgi:superfamily II DNA or RNA helicase
MKVLVDSWAWVGKNDLGSGQLEALRKALTIVPRKVGDHPGDPPSPISLFSETSAAFGMPRQFFLRRRKPAHDVEYRVTTGDMSTWPGPLKLVEGFTLREEQARAKVSVVGQLKGGSLGGIVRAPCGWGKTVLACALIESLQVPTLVVVHKEFLMDQWKERIRAFLPNAKIGTVQGSVCDYKARHIVIGMMQSLCDKDYGEEFRSYFGLFCSDECVTGESLITTELGPLPIRSLGSYPSIKVLTYDESSCVWEYRKVVRWIPRGRKRVLRVSTSNSTLYCTPEHQILTSNGWMLAQNLTVGTRVLSPAVAAVGRSLLATAEVAQENISKGILELGKRRWIGRLVDLLLKPLLLFADAAVGSGSNFQPPSNVSVYELLCGPKICLGTIMPVIEEPSPYQLLDCYTGPYLVTPVLFDHTLLRIPECHLLTGGYSTNGQSIRHRVLKDLESKQDAVVVRDMGSSVASASACVIPNCSRYSIRLEPQNESPKSGWISYQRRGGLGGIWTMVPSIVAGLFSILRGSLLRKWTSLLKNLSRWVFQLSNLKPNIVTALSDYVHRTPFCGSSASNDSLLQGCTTSFQSITRIDETPLYGEEAVFDLEVEANHNFVANGILVHNCHRVGAALWSRVPPLFPARYRIGISATPRRKDGAEDVFRFHIGDVIFNASEQRMKPKIRRVWTGYKPVQTNNFNPSLLGKNMILKFMCANTKRNTTIIEQIILAVKAGRKCLVLSERLQHLRDMETLLLKLWKDADGSKPSIGYYIGGQEQDALSEAAKQQVILATSQLVQEGLDIPALDTLFITTPLSDIEQASGRILRPSEGKKEPIIVDFRDDEIGLCRRFAEFRDKQYERIA